MTTNDPDEESDNGESFAEKRRQAAEDIHDVALAIEKVDLNLLEDDDVRELLELKAKFEDLAGRYRSDQHAAESEEGEGS